MRGAGRRWVGRGTRGTREPHVSCA
ncbi:hypothetical protein E2C01_085292 [Portunus trituberculatus]|uniref:Uncharacterized protein n=1 Tax=Portunus trituberculatus TaxID=210409 RepID=A0A5B7J8H2_PORTR|nr:hypothetical protein [Portunus trituberculatus]